ncbi:MAG: CPBP family intramembrane metalloprotease [Clostridiales bacterium]|nr:CPBP family intramembrane metalloprotease [Clostridiales bacterium]
MSSAKRKHVVLDHPILGFFILDIFASLMQSFGNVLDAIIVYVLPGYGTKVTFAGIETTSASGVGTAVGAVGAAIIFWLWFRPDFDGCFKKKGLLKGLLMMAAFLVVHWSGSVVSWLSLGTGSVLIAFLRAFAPGFGEEIAYRALGVANYMRTIKSEKGITVIFWLSSAVFGLVHAANILAGANVFSTVIQVVYATGVGMLFCAVYLRTGNIWPCVIAHLSVDFMEFVRADLSGSGGVMAGLGIGDWITVAAGAGAAVMALIFMRKQYYPEIMDIWAKKWSKSLQDTL